MGRLWQTLRRRRSPTLYRGFRFPPEIIAHAVWLYHCFSLSLRDVELILAARGVTVSHETIRDWGIHFGRQYATALKRRRPKPGDKWHLDEVFIRIRGKIHYLWRAVDQNGVVLDVLVQRHRDTSAAKRDILPKVEHRQSRYLNNPNRGFASTDPATRTAHAAVQIDTACPTLPLRS
jgi:putative transposase